MGRWATVGAMLAACALAAGCDAAIQHGLSEAQANEVVVQLHDAAIGATKELEEERGDEARYRVRVASGDVARALSVLRAADLPREPEPGLGEMFDDGSLVPSATEERARYVAAIGGELSRSLETIDGVLDARVHVAVAGDRQLPLDGERPPARASVLVEYRRGAGPPDEDAIRELVAGAVQRMRPEDVAVVVVPGPPEPSDDHVSLVHVGPIAVARGSAPLLEGLLAGALGLHALLAGGLLTMVVRQRKRKGAKREHRVARTVDAE